MFTVRITQHAVGQGGMTSGTITTNSRPLRWVYDCGSNQTDSLASEVAQVTRDGSIDLLFLSHLDSDHINGIDLLLASCTVKEVVLPYLADETIVAIIARDVSRGRLSGLLLDAVPDVAGWFASRGVNTITFIDGEDDDQADDFDGLTPPNFDRGDDGEGPVNGKWSPTPDAQGEHARPQLRRTMRQGPSISQRAAARASLSLFTERSTLNWILLPYVHAPPARLMAAFREEVEQAFGRPLNLASIANAVRSAPGRLKLRECYDALWLDHNLVSMTLYAGPRWAEASRSDLRWGQQKDYWPHGPGWMLTGDAHLEQTKRRERFLRRYRTVIEWVGVLMLPHHGSAHNFDPALIEAMPSLYMCFAASGPNSYGHPHSSVREAVEASFLTTFHRVSSSPPSRLISDISI